MPARTIGRIVDAALEADARGDPLEPAAIALLLRQYVSTGRDDVAAAAGRGLARGLESPDLGLDPAAWLELFAEAAPLTEDDRIRAAAAALATRLEEQWPSRGIVAPAMRSVGACLMTALTLDEPHRNRLISAAVDELERIVGRVYRPGERIAHSLDAPDEDDGDLADHVCTAVALLNGHAVTGRLPYSMLAEELMKIAGAGLATGDVAVRCEMARVLCRLAALHGDEEYRRTAVVAPGSDCADEAARILATIPHVEDDARASIYGLALDDWLRVTRQMQ